MQVGINQSPNRYYPVNKFQPNFQKSPNYFNANNQFRQQQHANQGQGNIEFDGKRLRKAVSRKTVDYNAVIVKYLEARAWQRDVRDRRAIQPDVGYYTEILPPMSMLENPVNSITTKFVRTSTNKMRCPIFCVVWTPEGRRLITGASSGEFTLWNGLTFNFETILQAHDSPVRCMVWSHNDTWMVTGDHSGYVKYWQSNMNNVKMFQAHKEPLRGISFCPTDTKFVTCSDDGTVRIWDFLRCSEEKILRGHGADVKCVAWHPQKSLIVSGSKDSQQPIKLWDPKSGTSLATIHAHKSTVMEVKWNQNGTWMLTASRDHLLKLFDIRNMSQEIQTFRGHKKEACSISWHPVHESMFVSGGSDGSVMFWVVGAEKEVGAMEQAHDSCVWSLAWHPLGHILCTGSNDHTSKFWTRNRPGDRMRDKYNLNTLPKGLDETNEYDDISTSSLVIPGMGMEMPGPDQTGISIGVNSLADIHSQSQIHRAGPIPEGMMAGIPGLDFNDDANQNEKQELQQQQRKVPFSKPIPRQFQQQWMENKQPLLLAPPSLANKDDKKNLGPPLVSQPTGDQGVANPLGGPTNQMPMNMMPNQMGGSLNQMGGPPNQMGGPPNQMGGPPNQMGGPMNPNIGSSNQMGPPNQMGLPNQIGGPMNSMNAPQNQIGGPPNQMGGGPNQMMAGPPSQMGNSSNQMGMPTGQPGNQLYPARSSRTTFVTSHPVHFNQQEQEQNSRGPSGQMGQSGQNSRGPLLGQHPGFVMNPQEEPEFPQQQQQQQQQRPNEDHQFWSTREGSCNNDQSSFHPMPPQQEDELGMQEDFDERTTGGGGMNNRAPLLSNISFHTGNNYEGNFQQNRDFGGGMDEDMRNGDNYGGGRKRQWNDGAMEGSFQSGNSGPRNYNMRGGRGMGSQQRGGRSFRRGGGNSGMFRGGRGSRRGGF